VNQTSPRVLIGHGTENDFVVLPDPDGTVWPEDRLDGALVRRLCDRRAGLGGDGVLRVVRSVHVPDAAAVLGEDLDRCEWFMDHRNADGSTAEMCGNGIRLFLHVLVSEGLLDRGACEAGVLVGTRGGPRRVGAAPDGGYWVDMGPAKEFGAGKAELSGRSFSGLAVSMGNPHLACLTDADIDALDLTGTPSFDAALGADGRTEGTVRVDVPGGRLSVQVTPGTTVLTGPAVIVSAGVLCAEWLGG
jgi:diaminopimelate epimerase